MKKLQIEELVVDSFTTSDGTDRLGTVHGHQVTDAGTGCGTDGHTCGTWCTNYCEDTTGGGGTVTYRGISCDMTCVQGATDCGTCAPYYTCDAAEGTQCWGNSLDNRPC